MRAYTDVTRLKLVCSSLILLFRHLSGPALTSRPRPSDRSCTQRRTVLTLYVFCATFPSLFIFNVTLWLLAGDNLCVSLCAASSDDMSVCAGQGSDEVVVSQAVWDYLAAAGRPWLIDFQQKQGMSAGIIRRGEKGGCCAVRLQPVDGSRDSGPGVMDGAISSETRKAFIDLCRCARKEMSKQEGGTKRKRTLLPWVGLLEAHGEGSVVQPPPLQPRRSQRQQQQRLRKPSDEKACSVFHEVAQVRDMDSAVTAHSEAEDNKTCSICMGDIVEKTTLEKCGHSFCRSCLDQAFKVKKACPVCRFVYGQLIGNQPANGTMIVERDPDLELPGHEGYGCICIIYSFPPGLQSVSRPRSCASSDGTLLEHKILISCLLFASRNTPTQAFGIPERTAWPTSPTAPRGTACWACCARPFNSALSSPSVPP